METDLTENNGWILISVSLSFPSFLSVHLSICPSVCLWTQIVLHVLHIWTNADTSSASLCSFRVQMSTVFLLSHSVFRFLIKKTTLPTVHCPLHKLHAPSDTWDSCGIARETEKHKNGGRRANMKSALSSLSVDEYQLTARQSNKTIRNSFTYHFLSCFFYGVKDENDWGKKRDLEKGNLVMSV